MFKSIFTMNVMINAIERLELFIKGSKPQNTSFHFREVILQIMLLCFASVRNLTGGM